jgi:hypothetical protein
MSCPFPSPPTDRHDALLRAEWAPYAHALGHRPGEPLASFIVRVRAAIDIHDPTVPAVVRDAVRAVVMLTSATAMAKATGLDLLVLLGDERRN